MFPEIFDSKQRSFFFRCKGHNVMMIQGRKASLGFITHNFSNEKGERVNVLKKVEAHYTQKISYSYFLPS